MPRLTMCLSEAHMHVHVHMCVCGTPLAASMKPALAHTRLCSTRLYAQQFRCGAPGLARTQADENFQKKYALELAMMRAYVEPLA